jgi:hypothetical protein
VPCELDRLELDRLDAVAAYSVVTHAERKHCLLTALALKTLFVDAKATVSLTDRLSTVGKARGNTHDRFLTRTIALPIKRPNLTIASTAVAKSANTPKSR